MYILKGNVLEQEAIFDEATNKQISEWHDFIGSGGLLNNESDYYLVKRECDNKQAIYHKDDKVNPVVDFSNWIDDIELYNV